MNLRTVLIVTWICVLYLLWHESAYCTYCDMNLRTVLIVTWICILYLLWHESLYSCLLQRCFEHQHLFESHQGRCSDTASVHHMQQHYISFYHLFSGPPHLQQKSLCVSLYGSCRLRHVAYMREQLNLWQPTGTVLCCKNVVGYAIFGYSRTFLGHTILFLGHIGSVHVHTGPFHGHHHIMLFDIST